MTCVLDASALIAVLLSEPGQEKVIPLLPDAVLSTVTWAEVVARLVERKTNDAQIAGAARLVGKRFIEFDAAQGEVSGRLRETTRSRGLSLGDRCCLALAKSLGAPVLTADRAWAGLDVGVRIELIR
jgi:ribonuclease VapC